MTKLLFINWLVTAILEFWVLLIFFRKEWLSALHYATLVNAIIIALGALVFSKFGLDWLLLEAIIFAVEAVVVHIWFSVSLPKAILISLLINSVSAFFFPLLQYLGVDLSALL